MHRNRVSGYSKKSPSVMPRFHNRAVAVAVNRLSPDDDEDNNICPVCDGDCTCDNRPRLLPPNVNHGTARFVATPTTSTVSSGHALRTQPLKIKLTVPPSIQNKARALTSAPKKPRPEDPSAGVAGSSSVSLHLAGASSTAGHGQHNLSGAVGPKRKSRPSNALAITRDGKTSAVSDRKNRGNEVNTLPQSQSHPSSHTHTQRSVTSRAIRPQIETSKSNLVASRQTSKSQAKGTIAKRSASTKKKQDFLSDLTDSDLQPGIDTIHDDDDASEGRFPTFVLADELTSEASDSSDSDSDSDTSGFGSDSSLAAEEESYIVAEQRRHDKARVRRELLGDDVPNPRDSNNSWIIRPRKKSVGFSDVDMDGDTDNVTEDEEDEEMEDDEDEEDDEADGQASRAYTGLATGWSDDEQSSFDADLFFANLTDTSSDDSSSDSDGGHLHDSVTDPLANSASCVTSLRNVDFEVTEVWDGQVVFTNGSDDGHGVLDLAFEANAARLLASDSASISHDSDVEMRTSDGAEGDFDDGDSELGESDGDTTEEELVDEQGLPTSRAMRLFRCPTSVSSINPMSTVSPNVSPAARRRPPSTILESLLPADILAGRVFWKEADQSQQDSAESSAGESPHPIVRGGMPIMGQFSLEGNTPQTTAILTGANKDVPSPYPRLGHRRRFSSSAGSFSSMDLRGHTARLSIYPSFPPPSDEPSSETPLDIALGEPIKLDDVLDSTFLGSEPEMELSAIPDSEGEQKLAQSLSRWDRVPVGAFRITRESSSDVPTSPGWTSEPVKSTIPEVHSYDNVLKNSPLHTMLWNDKSRVKGVPHKTRGLTVSPVLLPVRDGDRTPTHIPSYDELHANPRQQHTPFKTRKESRREMKMVKRTTHAPSQKHHDHHQHHHRRNHHPNMKSRSNASAQRTFFSSPTSAPALNI